MPALIDFTVHLIRRFIFGIRNSTLTRESDLKQELVLVPQSKNQLEVLMQLLKIHLTSGEESSEVTLRRR